MSQKPEKVRAGESSVMFEKTKTWALDAPKGKTAFLHRCCGCKMEHRVEIEPVPDEEEIHITFTET